MAAGEDPAEQVRAVVERHVDPGDLLEEEEHARLDAIAGYVRGFLGRVLTGAK